MDFAGDGRNDALADGRRIYLGNLHYELRSEDIEEFLISNGFDDIENIQISVDAASGRNPGYCFVDFSQKATADRALNELTASLRGRELKVGPCEPRKKRTGDGRQGFQRSNDWRTQSGDDSQQFQGGEAREQRPRGFTRSDEVADESQGKRLYVGGLAKMGDPDQNTQEVMDIFTGFNPSHIGKRIAPPESSRSPAGTYYYCFVDFETKEEAEAAMQALDGAQYDGGLLKVSLAKRTDRQSNRPNTTSDRNGGQGRGWRSNNNSNSNSNSNSNGLSPSHSGTHFSTSCSYVSKAPTIKASQSSKPFSISWSCSGKATSIGYCHRHSNNPPSISGSHSGKLSSISGSGSHSSNLNSISGSHSSSLSGISHSSNLSSIGGSHSRRATRTSGSSHSHSHSNKAPSIDPSGSFRGSLTLAADSIFCSSIRKLEFKRLLGLGHHLPYRQCPLQKNIAGFDNHQARRQQKEWSLPLSHTTVMTQTQIQPPRPTIERPSPRSWRRRCLRCFAFDVP